MAIERRSRRSSYAFEKLAVDEAFDVPSTETERFSVLNRLRAARHYYERKTGWLFSIRWVAEDGVYEVARVEEGTPVDVHVHGVRKEPPEVKAYIPAGTPDLVLEDTPPTVSDIKADEAAAAVREGRMTVTEYEELLDRLYS